MTRFERWLIDVAFQSDHSVEELEERYGDELISWFNDGDDASDVAESVLEDDAKEDADVSDWAMSMEEA